VAARLVGAAVTGNAEEARATAGELKQADVEPDAVYPMAVTLGLSLHVLELGGRSADGDALYAKLEAMTGAAGDRSAVAMCLFFMVTGDQEAKKGNPAGMLENERKSRELAMQCGYRRLEHFATLGIAMCIWCLGAPEEAERMLLALPPSDTEFGPSSAFRPFVMAWLLAERGALAEARAHAEHLAFTLGHSRGLPLDEGRGRWVLSEVLRRAGALEEAEREIEAALALLGAAVPLDVPGALATKSALKLQQGKPVEALAAAEEGMSRQAAMGMHDHFLRGSFLRLVQVESLEANGRHAEARIAVASARDRLLAIAATITDPTYRESFLENVPENRRTLELAGRWLRS
jgi:ATP/maltotriose-dependent transcriptional regulator MalT